MALDTATLVLRPAVEGFSGGRGGLEGTCLVDRILKLQVTINYTNVDSVKICTHSIHQDCTKDDQAMLFHTTEERLQSGSIYFNIIGFTKRHLSPAVKNTGTLGG